MKFDIMFYRSDCSKAQWYDKLVAFFTKGLYSHVEIYNHDLKIGLRVSPRVNGAKIIHEPAYSKSNWDAIVVDGNKDTIYRMVNIGTSGLKYDYIGALVSALDRVCWIRNKNRIFCSYAVAECLGISKACSFSPNELYKHLKESIDG